MNTATEDALARVKSRARMATAEAAVASAIYESARAARELPDGKHDHARERIGIAFHAADEADTWARCAFASEQSMVETESPTEAQIESARQVVAHATDSAYVAARQLRELRKMVDAA